MPKKTNDEKSSKASIEGKRAKKGNKKAWVSQQTLQDQIRIYETFGADSSRKEGNRKYLSELKEAVDKAYLNGEVRLTTSPSPCKTTKSNCATTRCMKL